jgi:hypothetical protein
MRQPLVWLPGLVCAAVVLLAGCGQKSASVQQKDGLFLQGRARVVSVNPAIASATLEIDGKLVKAYWELEHMTAQGGAKIQQGFFKPPVGDYREPIVQVQDFPAREGDIVVFVGMKTPSGLFLRGVRPIGR